MGRGRVAELPLNCLSAVVLVNVVGSVVAREYAAVGVGGVVAVEWGRPVQSCLGEEGVLWIRGDDGDDLPADDDSLGPSGRIYTTTVHNIVVSFRD